MRKLIGVAGILLLVTAANHLPFPNRFSKDSGPLERNILCHWIGTAEREVRLDAAAEEGSPCSKVLIGPQTYRNQNNCQGNCEPVAIAAQIVERAKAIGLSIQDRFKSIFAASRAL